jgi:hypothetical protein
MWDMLQLVAGREPGICEQRSPLDKLEACPAMRCAQAHSSQLSAFSF